MRPAGGARWSVAAVADWPSACGNGESILIAGNESARPTVRTARHRRRPCPVTTVRPGTEHDAAGEPVTTPPSDQTPPPPRPRSTPCPPARSTPSKWPPNRSRSRSGTGSTSTTKRRSSASPTAYNASQDRVRVHSENQGGYLETIDKFFQSSEVDRPAVVMFPDYADAAGDRLRRRDPGPGVHRGGGLRHSRVPTLDLGGLHDGRRAMGDAVQRLQPGALLQPQRVRGGRARSRPVHRSRWRSLRQFSQQIVDSGAATYGIALDSGSSSGGGWYLEQWFANMGELYADNGNGRLAPATRVLYDGAAGVAAAGLRPVARERRTRRLRRRQRRRRRPVAEARRQQRTGRDGDRLVGRSWARCSNTLGGGLVPGLGPEDVGVGPLPGPGPTPTALVGGAALYRHGRQVRRRRRGGMGLHAVPGERPRRSRSSPRDTGYVPVRDDALEIEPALSVYRDDPRFRVAYDQLIKTPDSPALQGPILGPQREIRNITAGAVAEIFNGGDVQTALEQRRRPVERAARQLQRHQLPTVRTRASRASR